MELNENQTECGCSQIRARSIKRTSPSASAQSKRQKGEQLVLAPSPSPIANESFSLKPVLPFRTASHDGPPGPTSRSPQRGRKSKSRVPSGISPPVKKWRLAEWQSEPEIRPYWNQAEQRVGYWLCKQPRGLQKGAPRQLPPETFQLMEDLASLRRDVPGVLRRIVRNATTPGTGGESLSEGDEALLRQSVEECIGILESCRCHEETLRCVGLLVPFLGRAGKICPGSVVVPEDEGRSRTGGG